MNSFRSAGSRLARGEDLLAVDLATQCVAGSVAGLSTSCAAADVHAVSTRAGRGDGRRPSAFALDRRFVARFAQPCGVCAIAAAPRTTQRCAGRRYRRTGHACVRAANAGAGSRSRRAGRASASSARRRRVGAALKHRAGWLHAHDERRLRASAADELLASIGIGFARAMARRSCGPATWPPRSPTRRSRVRRCWPKRHRKTVPPTGPSSGGAGRLRRSGLVEPPRGRHRAPTEA